MQGEALGFLVRHMKSRANDEDDKAYLHDVLQRYLLNFATALTPRWDDAQWNGIVALEAEAAAKKAIVGEDALLDLFLFEEALKAAPSVVRILAPGGYGTGFLIAEDLIMTNNHVLPDRDTALATRFQSDYRALVGGEITPGILVDCAAPAPHFHTNQ